MTLLTEGNVSIRKLPRVIKNLSGKIPQRLPSKALLSSRIMMEARIVASKQVSLKSGSHLTVGLSGRDSELVGGVPQKEDLITYHGYRMNIYFYNALALYFHWEYATSFLTDWSNDNDLLKSLRFNIKEPLYRAGCRAMGMIHALIMEPFEMILKLPGNILDLNADLQKMLFALQVWNSDGSAAMKRDPVFGCGTTGQRPGCKGVRGGGKCRGRQLHPAGH
ncbi:hypothetical protein J4Q44_G00168700 [Coregonus suidteri]|uniref:Uncharacterized protein n=1 Tax=Coregonus suidteri TaxID=861788 RepID=A0AAN8LN41_9TELE